MQRMKVKARQRHVAGPTCGVQRGEDIPQPQRMFDLNARCITACNLTRGTLQLRLISILAGHVQHLDPAGQRLPWSCGPNANALGAGFKADRPRQVGAQDRRARIRVAADYGGGRFQGDKNR